MSTENIKVYDAENMVVGRLGSKAAKAAIVAFFNINLSRYISRK